MNVIDIILVIAIISALIVGFAIKNRRKKNGKGCCGNCNDCNKCN